MIRHGSSHGFALLICTVAAALLIELIRPKIPNIIAFFDDFSYRLIALFNLPLESHFMSVIIAASMPAFIWGVFFKIRTR